MKNVVISLLILIFLLVSLLSGCDEPGYRASYDEYGNIVSSPDPSYKVCSDESGQKTITIKEGIGHFSMEYPSGFELVNIKIDNSGGIESLFVDFIGPVTENVGFPWIHIYIQGTDPPKTEYIVKTELSRARALVEFKLLDESTITVAGVTAYQYSFHYDVYPYDPRDIPPEHHTLVTRLKREVYFDHSGLLWNISLSTDPSREEHDMAVFDKVLESFKVLE